MFPTKKKDDAPTKPANAQSAKIGKMSRLQRSQDLETSWRTGKTPASGYSEDDDPEFAAEGEDAQAPVPVEMSPDGTVTCPQCGCAIQPQEPQPEVQAQAAPQGGAPPQGSQGMF